MTRYALGIAVFIGLVGLTDSALAQPPKTVPVLGSFRCIEPGGLAGCATGDRVRGDGNAYPAQLSVTGNPLVLPITDGRFLAVHPGVPEAGSAMCNPCLAAALYNQVMWTSSAHLHVTVIDSDGNALTGGFPAIPPRESRPAKGKLNVWDPADGQALWVYRFDSADYPGSSNLVVTRTSQTEWVVQTDSAAHDRARLIYTRLKGKTFLNDEGVFSMPFAILIRQ